jgi:hypothetical protein
VSDLRKVAIALLIVASIAAAAAPRRERRPESAPMPVRFPEGSTHGFLELHTATGALLAHGDLLQAGRDGAIESRMMFHFANSVFDETVTFTQRDVFVMQNYHLVQSGPAFGQDLEVTLARSGAYSVTTKSHRDGKEKQYAGTLDLPPDTYNGMVVMIAKNLSAGIAETVHLVAFTPEPRVIGLQLAPMDTSHVLIVAHPEAVTHIALKPKLGTMLKFFATVTGQVPPDSHVWIVTDQVPAFVRFEGPMYSGPVWRINLTSPSWPR